MIDKVRNTNLRKFEKMFLWKRSVLNADLLYMWRRIRRQRGKVHDGAGE